MIKKTLLVVCLLFYSFWSYDYFSFSKKEYDKLTLPTIDWNLLKFWEISEAKAYVRDPASGGTHDTVTITVNVGDDVSCNAGAELLLWDDSANTYFVGSPLVSPIASDYVFVLDTDNPVLSSLLPLNITKIQLIHNQPFNEICAEFENTYPDTLFTLGETEEEEPLIAMIWQLFNTFLSVLPFVLSGLVVVAFVFYLFGKVEELISDYRNKVMTEKDRQRNSYNETMFVLNDPDYKDTKTSIKKYRKQEKERRRKYFNKKTM